MMPEILLSESTWFGLSNVLSDVLMAFLVAEISSGKKQGFQDDLSQEWNIVESLFEKIGLYGL